MDLADTYRTARSAPFFREDSYNAVPFYKTEMAGQTQEWESERYFLIYSKATVSEPVSFTVNHKKPYVQLFFLLQGNEWCCRFDENTSLSLNKDEYALFYLPANTERTITWHPAELMELFVVNIDAKYYFSKFETVDPMNDLQKRLLKGEVLQGLNISGKMHEIIGAMIYLSCNAFLKKLHLETKVSELALVQFEQLLTIEQKETKNEWGRGDNREVMQKMQIIQSYLHQHSHVQHSLKSLAQLVNSNTTYVKSNFKLVFGVSVFQYINQVRMQKAQRLLSSSDLTVAQVAEEVGYKYHTHFTAAFKKYFGVLPKKTRFFQIVLSVAYWMNIA